MPKNIYLPKENIPKVEEIRYLNKQENYQTSKFAKTFLSTVYCADKEEKTKESLKDLHSGAIIGSGAVVGTATLNPGTGAAASGTMGGLFKGLGKVEKFVGEVTDSEGLKKAGEVHDEGSTKALEEVGKKIVGK